MENDESVIEYATRFNKILKGVDYNENYTHKMKVRKFLNGLINRLAELIQIQSPANLDDAIIATSSVEMRIKCKNRYRNNIYIMKTIKALRNQVKVFQTKV